MKPRLRKLVAPAARRNNTGSATAPHHVRSDLEITLVARDHLARRRLEDLHSLVDLDRTCCHGAFACRPASRGSSP